MLRRTLIAAFAALCLALPAFAADWTERYFGVGSAAGQREACGLARDHAQGNSLKACVDRRGKRGDAAYTDCICSSADESLQVCNVNLKVLCDGASAGSDSGSLRRGGPEARAGRSSDGSPRRAGRPGPEVGR